MITEAKPHINKFDALKSILRKFEQGTITSAYFELRRWGWFIRRLYIPYPIIYDLSNSSINFPSDDMSLKAERSTRGQGKSHA